MRKAGAMRCGVGGPEAAGLGRCCAHLSAPEVAAAAEVAAAVRFQTMIAPSTPVELEGQLDCRTGQVLRNGGGEDDKIV